LAPGRIVAAAIAVADAEGLAGLSMRRVATEIGVATMSLYLELEADAEAASGLNSEEWLDTQGPALRAIVGAGPFPVFERVTAADYDFNLENLFEFGLQRLLDGLTALIDGRPPEQAPAVRLGRVPDMDNPALAQRLEPFLPAEHSRGLSRLDLARSGNCHRDAGSGHVIGRLIDDEHVVLAKRKAGHHEFGSHSLQC
jgi:hypothetical protein